MKAIDLGGVFADDEVAALYQFRAPYPHGVFSILERLVVGPRVILDAGTGTGALARRFPPSIERIDAVDPSPAMIARGRALPGGDDARIRWIVGRAENAPLSPPYGLITVGASLHWMQADVVLPRFRDTLAPGARLAIVDTETTHSGEWRTEMLDIIRRYSPLEHHVETHEMVSQLAQQGVLSLEGEERTSPEEFDQSVDDYLRLLGSTSTLSCVTLGSRAAAFDAACRDLFARHRMTRIRSSVVGYVAWSKLP
ncbi:MAG TPA: class I SAM-dependent methyltransferase [Candidatus Limnocylindria bacterium]|jgi:ubiquinone/menaquinone biosynthesis C-methylase UbiE|nr:class I SAM-dependent methyltransferase [Candidatus Limnocylindria bacterium]